MKYRKMGKGRVLKCYLTRITKTNFELDNIEAICPNCRSVFGRLQSGLKDKYIKIDQKQIKPVQV
jgi:Zn finger protein HypA/HybF involved in hydrogenase expression